MFNRIVRVEIEDLVISALKIEFKIEKSLVGYPNLGNIKIYNLSENSRNQIEEKDLKVQLYAGYEDTETALLFDGDIVNVVHLKQGTDWISEIFAADGIKALNAATINKSFSAGATIDQIYGELTGKLDGISKGITQGIKECLTGKRSILRQLTLSGSVKDWLKKIAQE